MEMMTRRAFNGALAGTALAAMLPPARLLAQPGGMPGDQIRTAIDWQRVGDDAFAGIGFGGNTLVVLGERNALLIDTKNAGIGSLLRREAEMLGRPVRWTINTHHHADHTGGNNAFTPDTMVYSQEKAVARIENQLDRYRAQAEASVRELAGSDIRHVREALVQARDLAENFADLEDPFTPTKTFSDGMEIDEPGVRAHVRHRGPGHTDNDAFIHLPDRNILHTGDLVFHKLHPYIDLGAGATIDGWIESCEQMIGLCDENTVVIPGHGEVSDVSCIRGQVEYFETMRRLVRHAKHVEGMTREEVQKMTPSQFRGYGLERLRSMNLGIVWDEV